jgi:VCBS repeat-containing protein
MTAITEFSGSSQTLANALLAQNSGIQIVGSSVALNASASTAVGLYDGTLAPLGINAGIVLTTGTMPGTTNTDTGFGVSNNAAGNALIDQAINPVFSTASYDATTLSFSFNVTDPTATSISFDIVFGSDEYPEWVDAFVDAGVVFVNGVNYALFNHDPLHPLSVISQNTQAGYFQDNTAGTLPIEYDGISKVLTIVAPIIQGGLNTITIGVADCGDHILDSGLFLSGMRAGTLPGSGVVIGASDNSTSGNDVATGSNMSELFSMGAGDDQVFAGGGDDIVAGDAGADSLYGGSGDDALTGGAGNDDLNGGVGNDVAGFAGASTDYAVSYDAATGAYTIAATGASVLDEGTDTLTGVETLSFSNGNFYLTQTGLSAVAPVAPATNVAGTAIISGIAAANNVLTVMVSDADGVPATVDYDWQVSTDNGSTWMSTGVMGDAYTVQASDAGAMFRVIATYTDGAGVAEIVTSQPKLVPAAALNTLVVDLLNLDAPIGASTMNPLTTLVARAIDLGLSPNSAEAAIKAALGIDPAIKLLSYDAYAAAMADPADALALKVEAIAVQVAVLTSLSNDDTGSKLALALIEANAAGTVLDLANVDVLSALTGVPAVLDPLTGKYPQPLAEIFDRNGNLSGAGTVADIEKEWQDLLTIQDQIASTSIADLSLHINQAPTGMPMGALAGMQDQPVTIALADLLNGLSDPEGSALAVTGLSADQPGTVTQNPDGSWSFVAANGYAGPVELSYAVVDPQGASLTVTKMLIIDPTPIAVNVAPVVSGPVAVAVSEDAVAAFDPLANALDANGDALAVVLPATLTDGFTYDAATGQMTFDASGAAYQSLAAGETVVVSQTYDVTDGAFSTAASVSVTVTGANDAAVIAGTSTGTVTEDRALLASGTLSVSDVDTGEAAFVAGQVSGTYGSATIGANGDWTYTLDTTSAGLQTLGTGATLTDTLTVQSLDGTTATLSITINGLDDFAGATPILGTTLGDTVTGTNGADVIYGLDGNDTLYGLDGDDTIDGGVGVDLVDAGAGNDMIYIGSVDEGVGKISSGGVMGGTGYDTVIVDGISTDYVVTSFVLSPTEVQRKITNLTTGKFSIMTGIEAIEFSDGVRIEYVPPNHAPTGTATALLTGTEDTPTVITLADLVAGFTDADGDVLAVTGLTSSAGVLVDNLDGIWSLTTDANFNGDLSLSYTVIDGNGGSIAASNTLSIAAVNDAAIISGQATGSVTEDATLQASGTLSVSDVDAGEAAFVAGTLAGSYGSATLTATGDWTYTLNNAAAAVQALAGGASVQDSLTVTTLDGTTATLAITINGADEPVVAGVTLTGTSAANVLTGGAGADTLLGLGGNDKLIGGDGNDILNGGTNADTMIGGAGDDTYHVDNKYDVVTENPGGGIDSVLTTLSKYLLGANVENVDYLGTQNFTGTGNVLDNLIAGGKGSDVLSGGGGSDTLQGDLGNDKLDGGLGSDILSGGGGADLFIFKTAADASDTITDFAHLVDDIDLHLIDANVGKASNQAFSFIGTSAFGALAGQLRFDLTADGAHVQGDVNGDGVADFDMVLSGVTTLTASDFIL